MSENPKCPVCLNTTSIWEDSEICVDGEVECSVCGFRCCKKDFTRVVAAMELAKKLSKIHELGHKWPTSDCDKYNERVVAMSEALEDYQSAKDRVFEVFNG